MKFLDNNNRKLGLAFILVGLMIVIVGFGKYFEESLKVATLTQNNILEFEEYEILNGEIKYKLPSEWIATEKVNDDMNDSYVNEFISENASIYGSIELINGSNGVEYVLEECIADIKGMGINKFERDSIKINELEVEVVEYDLKFTNNSVKRAYEYYIPYEEDMVKITFMISDEKTRENTNVVFENIVKTFSFEN